MKGMRSWAEIDLAKLERNLRLIRESIPSHFKYVSVVKADAYGHGILPTASRLMQSGVDLFAVANVKEANEIREMGSGWPILVLGPLLKEEDEALTDLDLIPSLSSMEEVKRFEALSQTKKRKIKVHLKVLEENSVFNAVRIGLLQFGVTPPTHSALAHLEVEPVLSFHAKLALVKDLPAQTSVSYGRLHTLARNSRIGIISAGYGDAIPLHCGNQASALIRGTSYPIVGRVTMDQTLIDLTDAPCDLANGEVVTLIGEQNGNKIPLETLALHGKTIPWELLCSITKRVPRIYLTKRE